MFRAVTAGFTFITVAKAMSSVAATTPGGLRGSAVGSPGRRRLQKLLGVPGCAPNRTNDLLLLRPDTGGEDDKHVVFFHGDIQVRLQVNGFSCMYGSPEGTVLFHHHFSISLQDFYFVVM